MLFLFVSFLSMIVKYQNCCYLWKISPQIIWGCLAKCQGLGNSFVPLTSQEFLAFEIKGLVSRETWVPHL